MRRLIPIYTWNKSIFNFNRTRDILSSKPWFQGVLLLVCVIAAMLLANLPSTKEFYHSILETNILIQMSSADGTVNWVFPHGMTVEKFINDILMVVFFFTVGLEIKREIAHGELSSMKKAITPVIAAIGGVIVPALIYTIVNHGTPASSGWGIPTATDIAFAVCILTMLGNKVPVAMKVFLTALAIADDLIAILVVALFYGGSINFQLLSIALVAIIIALILGKLGEKRLAPYLFLTLIVWIMFYYSGVHATMSGVVMAFLIPSKPRYNKHQYIHKRDRYIALLDVYGEDTPDEEFPNALQKHCLRRLHNVAQRTIDLSYTVEKACSPWVTYFIMPVFALANAGVCITDLSYFNVFNFDPVMGSVSMGIFLGLLIGKPLGISIFTWLAVKLKIGNLPKDTDWLMFVAVSCLAGIGFTMSIFVDSLSFADQPVEIMRHLRDAGKVAVLMGSLCAGVMGTIFIRTISRLRKIFKSV